MRATDRLVDNPARLVAPDGDHSHEMDRVRRILDRDFGIPKRVLEPNRRYPLIQNLSQLVTANMAEAVVNDCIVPLYESSLLQEGLHPNPADRIGRIQNLMQAATRPA